MPNFTSDASPPRDGRPAPLLAVVFSPSSSAVRPPSVSPLSAVERGKVPIVNRKAGGVWPSRAGARGQRAKGGILARCQKRLGERGERPGEVSGG